MKNRLGLAITSFLLGLVGFLTALAGIGLMIHLPGYGKTVTIIFLIALLLGLGSLILGLVGRRTSSAGLAVTGATLGSITTMLTVLLMVIGYLFYAGHLAGDQRDAAQQEPAQQVQVKQADKQGTACSMEGSQRVWSPQLRVETQRFSVPLLDAKLNVKVPNQLWVLVDAYPYIKLAALGKEIGRDYQERCAMLNINVVIADGEGPRVEISVKEGKLVANAFAL